MHRLAPRPRPAQVSAHFGLTFERGKLLTRCAKCNGAVERRCTPEEVAASAIIPEKVKRSTSDFWACARCGKVYWVGPKSHKAIDFINSTVEPVVTMANHEMQQQQRRREEEAELIEEALKGDPWPRR